VNEHFERVPFATAAAYVIRFGKYRGKTVDEIASSNGGLRYLDWMRGALHLDFHTANAVCSYLEDPTIAKDLAELVKGRG
jgi:predicted alpha/beta hydrolase